MAATGKTPILLYGSTTATNQPSAGNLTNSSDGCEIAINVADKNLFFKDSTNTVNTVPIRQSSASSDGWLSSTDWSTFNGKQTALVSGTNIKTVSGTSLLGSGDLGTIGTSYGGTGLTSFNSSGLMYASSSSALTTSSAIVTDGTNLGINQYPTCRLHVYGAYDGSAPSTSSTPIAKFREGGATSLWVGGTGYDYMWMQSIQDDGSNTSKGLKLNPLGGYVSVNAGMYFNNGSSSLLNDYEEGTWTPVLGADGGQSGQTYGNQTGYYTKIGNLVVATAIIRLTALGTLTGTYAVISGLPYTSTNGTGNQSNGDVVFGYAAGFATNVNTIGGYVPSSNTIVYLTGAASTGTAPYDLFGKSILGNSTFVSVTITYRAA